MGWRVVPGLCGVPVIDAVCHAVGNATKSIAGGVFDGIATAFANGLATVIKALMTFWINVPEPNLSTPGGAVATIEGLTRPLVAGAAIIGLLIGGARLALTAHQTESLQQIGRGLVLMTAVTAAGTAFAQLLLVAFDAFAKRILDTGFDGTSVGTRLAELGALPAVGGGLLFLLAFFGMIASLIQVGIMLIRGAVLAVLVGLLPIAAGASITGTGFEWFKKLWGWILSFSLYKLAAAIVYAAAFVMIGDSRDLAGIVGGFSLLILAILALPALLRLIPPATTAMGSPGGGAVASLVAAGATGAVALGGSRITPPAPTMSPGLLASPSGGGNPSAPTGGNAMPRYAALNPPQASAKDGAAGTTVEGAAGKAGAGGAAVAGSAGAAAGAGVQAYEAAKGAATKAIETTDGGQP
jgi:type IV secretion system protein TrbL